MADPRACGPLALTWTGSLLNGFNIPAVVPTLSEFPAPVRALIDNWTMRMDGVVDTDAVIDLAIVFAKEAMDYADASRSNQQSSSEDEPSDENEDDQDRSEEHTSELQSLMRISYAVFCLKKKTENKTTKDKDRT